MSCSFDHFLKERQRRTRVCSFDETFLGEFLKEQSAPLTIFPRSKTNPVVPEPPSRRPIQGPRPCRPLYFGFTSSHEPPGGF
jgi:hypothetical protein